MKTGPLEAVQPLGCLRLSWAQLGNICSLLDVYHATSRAAGASGRQLVNGHQAGILKVQASQKESHYTARPNQHFLAALESNVSCVRSWRPQWAAFIASSWPPRPTRVQIVHQWIC